MPVTAKLSRKFYDTFGDDIAGELVEWFNSVDAAYRSEFRNLFEVHFSRFEAKLEQFRAQFDAKLEQLRTEFDAKREQFHTEFDAKLEQFRTEMRTVCATKEEVTALRIRIEALESRLIRWMFIFWVGTLGTLVALLKL
jgi:hypothetical protein